MSAASPTNSDGSPSISLDDDPKLSQEDIKPDISTGKTSRKPRQKSYGKQEVLMLSQAYMQESLDPIHGTSNKADIMRKDVCNSYNKMIVEFNWSNMDCLTLGSPFTPLPLRTWPSLKILVKVHTAGRQQIRGHPLSLPDEFC